MSMHAVGQGINKIQDVREITEEESWTRIWGGGPEYGQRDLSRIWEETKSPGKATWTVSTAMRFDTLHIFAAKGCNGTLYLCRLWRLVGSLEEIPSVEGERGSIFYSRRVHEVLMRPESSPQWDQRTWITQGLLAKGILKDEDLVVQC